MEFELILDQVLSAVSVDSESETDIVSVVERTHEVVAGFESTSPFNVMAENIPGGYEQVFSPDSRVCYRESGTLSEDVTIIEPAIIDGPLMYRVEVKQSRGPTLRRYIPATSVEPSADTDAWEYRWWNRETQTYQDPPNEDEPN